MPHPGLPRGLSSAAFPDTLAAGSEVEQPGLELASTWEAGPAERNMLYHSASHWLLHLAQPFLPFSVDYCDKTGFIQLTNR